MQTALAAVNMLGEKERTCRNLGVYKTISKDPLPSAAATNRFASNKDHFVSRDRKHHIRCHGNIAKRRCHIFFCGTRVKGFRLISALGRGRSVMGPGGAAGNSSPSLMETDAPAPKEHRCQFSSSPSISARRLFLRRVRLPDK